MSEDIQKEPVAPPTVGRPSVGSLSPDLRYATAPPFPRTVTVAGVIWIAFGFIIILSKMGIRDIYVGLTNVLSPMAVLYLVAEAHELIFLGVFGAVFLYVCIQSIRGAARDMLTYGIASILFGFLYLGGPVIDWLFDILYVGSGLSLDIRDPRVIRRVVEALGGVMLLAAGILALVGRRQYKLWRQAQQPERNARQRT